MRVADSWDLHSSDMKWFTKNSSLVDNNGIKVRYMEDQIQIRKYYYCGIKLVHDVWLSTGEVLFTNKFWI